MYRGLFFFFQAEDGIRDYKVTGVQTCALPICYCTPRRSLPAFAGAVAFGRAEVNWALTPPRLTTSFSSTMPGSTIQIFSVTRVYGPIHDSVGSSMAMRDFPVTFARRIAISPHNALLGERGRHAP